MVLGRSLQAVYVDRDLRHTNALKLGHDLQWKVHVDVQRRDPMIRWDLNLHLLEVQNYQELIGCHRER